MWSEIATLVGVPVIRSVAGWLENAMEDKHISAFEYGELAATVLRMGVVGFGLYFGFDMNAVASASSALLLDFLFKAVKK